MTSFPNQQLYIINKKIEEGDIFIMLRWEEYCAAANELSPSALNLYMYLAKNKDGYEFFFSSKDYRDTFNVTDRTFRNAKSELISKGYLKEGEKNKVLFSSSGSFKETKESLQEELKEIGRLLQQADNKIYGDFLLAIDNAKLKSITEENIYKNEIKKLILFGRDLLNNLTDAQINDLI